jgi:hypothetical protein
LFCGSLTLKGAKALVEPSVVLTLDTLQVPRLLTVSPLMTEVGVVGIVNASVSVVKVTLCVLTTKPSGLIHVIRRVTRKGMMGAFDTLAQIVSPRLKVDFGVTQSAAKVSTDSTGLAKNGSANQLENNPHAGDVKVGPLPCFSSAFPAFVPMSPLLTATASVVARGAEAEAGRPSRTNALDDEMDGAAYKVAATRARERAPKRANVLMKRIVCFKAAIGESPWKVSTAVFVAMQRLRQSWPSVPHGAWKGFKG